MDDPWDEPPQYKGAVKSWHIALFGLLLQAALLVTVVPEATGRFAAATILGVPGTAWLIASAAATLITARLLAHQGTRPVAAAGSIALGVGGVTSILFAYSGVFLLGAGLFAWFYRA